MELVNKRFPGGLAIPKMQSSKKFEIQILPDGYLKNWKILENDGMRNCGLYTKDKKLIKCTEIKQELLKTQIMVEFLPDLIPRIFGYYKKDTMFFIEMEKMMGSISDYIFLYYIPKSMIYSTMKLIYELMLPHTTRNIFKNPALVEGSNFWMEMENSTLTWEIYRAFFDDISFKVKAILVDIRKQIFLHDIKLLELGLEFGDRKYDNYLLDENFNVKLTDLGDVEFVTDFQFHKQHIADEYYREYDKFGQYPFRLIGKAIPKDYMPSQSFLEKLPTEIIKILSSDWNLLPMIENERLSYEKLLQKHLS